MGEYVPFGRIALLLDLGEDTFGLVIDTMATFWHFAVAFDLFLAAHVAGLLWDKNESGKTEWKRRLPVRYDVVWGPSHRSHRQDLQSSCRRARWREWDCHRGCMHQRSVGAVVRCTGTCRSPWRQGWVDGPCRRGRVREWEVALGMRW